MNKIVLFLTGALLAVSSPAATISVNFHVGNDADNQAEHELTGSEAAGLDGNTTWNNINVGTAGGPHNSPVDAIFLPTVLTDNTGDTSAATLEPSAVSTYFVGYAASDSDEASELELAGNHDDLFNSYLGLGSSDAAVLRITGLGAPYTNQGYSVIVYSDTDRGHTLETGPRTSTFELTPEGGSAITRFTEDDPDSGSATFDGTYIKSDGVNNSDDYSNYVIFEGLTAGSFELSLYSDDGGRAGISGFQIVSLPPTISVNFHVGNDGQPEDHKLTGSQAAGLDGNTTWNNINVGTAGGPHNSPVDAIFLPTVLTDNTGDTSAATLTPSPDSTYFVGYAASAWDDASELGLAGNHDDLFNSYLGLGAADAAVLQITGLGATYTSLGYSVIVYSDTDKGPVSGNRTSTFELTPDGGSAITLFTEDDASGGLDTFDGTYIKSDGFNDSVDYSNYVIFSNLTAGSFELSLYSDDGGRAGISGFQIVATVPPSPTISQFEADDVYVPSGTTVTLSWEVNNAASLQLSGVGDVTGQSATDITPTETTTYTLTAENAAGTDTAQVRVVVAERPNILLILVDDYGPMDTSVPFVYTSYNDAGTPVVTAFNNFYHTPNMETLAGRGMKFTQAYALPVCSPSRASLMTGYNSPRHGVDTFLNPGREIDPGQFDVTTERGPNNWAYQGLTMDDVTLPKLLGAEGYRTIHCGKAHFGSDVNGTGDPTGIGFDVNIAGSERGQPGSYTGDYGNDLPGMDEYENTGTFLTAALTQAMNQNIAQAVSDGVPFFGYMSYYAVHSPFTANSDATQTYNGVSTEHENFATMVEGVDISLGDILQKLDELDVAEDTLIFFMGDNGSDSPALTDEDDAVGSSFDDYPMRGKKGSTYEGGSRIPLIVSWASNDVSNVFQQSLPITGGSVEHDIVGIEDVMPSILAAADATPSDYTMDGHDLSPYLRSESGTHRPQKILRYMPHEHRSDYFLWYREGDWKIMYRFHTDEFELYNLTNDPDESDDLASAQPGRVLRMARAMARELDDSWGVRGTLWPTHNPSPYVAVPDRPLEDDPFVIPFNVDGRDAIDSDGDGLTDEEEDADADGLLGPTETDPDVSDIVQDGTLFLFR